MSEIEPGEGCCDADCGQCLAKPVGRRMRWSDALYGGWSGGHLDAAMALADAEVAAAVRVSTEQLRAGLEAVRALCYHDGYTTWDVDKHLPGKGWKPDDPKVLAWEAAHGHDPRLKCYPEYGCQLLIDPEDILAALAAGLGPDRPTTPIEENAS